MACLQKLHMNRWFSMMCSWIVGAMLGCYLQNWKLWTSTIALSNHRRSVSRCCAGTAKMYLSGLEVEKFFFLALFGGSNHGVTKPFKPTCGVLLDVPITWCIKLFFSGFLLKHLKSKQFRKNHSDGLADSNWLIQAALDTSVMATKCMYVLVFIYT